MSTASIYFPRTTFYYGSCLNRFRGYKYCALMRYTELYLETLSLQTWSTFLGTGKQSLGELTLDTARLSPEHLGRDAVTFPLTCKLTTASLPFKPNCNGFMALFSLPPKEAILHRYRSSSQRLVDLSRI